MELERLLNILLGLISTPFSPRSPFSNLQTSGHPNAHRHSGPSPSRAVEFQQAGKDELGTPPQAGRVSRPELHQDSAAGVLFELCQTHLTTASLARARG